MRATQSQIGPIPGGPKSLLQVPIGQRGQLGLHQGDLNGRRHVFWEINVIQVYWSGVSKGRGPTKRQQEGIRQKNPGPIKWNELVTKIIGSFSHSISRSRKNTFLLCHRKMFYCLALFCSQFQAYHCGGLSPDTLQKSPDPSDSLVPLGPGQPLENVLLAGLFAIGPLVEVHRCKDTEGLCKQRTMEQRPISGRAYKVEN